MVHAFFFCCSRHAYYDRDEFDDAIVPVPLHVFERLEVGFVEAHELRALHRSRVESHYGWGVVYGDGLHPFYLG